MIAPTSGKPGRGEPAPGRSWAGVRGRAINLKNAGARSASRSTLCDPLAPTLRLNDLKRLRADAEGALGRCLPFMDDARADTNLQQPDLDWRPACRQPCRPLRVGSQHTAEQAAEWNPMIGCGFGYVDRPAFGWPRFTARRRGAARKSGLRLERLVCSPLVFRRRRGPALRRCLR